MAIKTIVVDSVSALCNSAYAKDIAENKGRTRKDWGDVGVEIYQFVEDISKLGGQPVYIVGAPGTGKTFGMRTLNPRETLWFNADKRPPTFPGGRKSYIKGKNWKEPSTIAQVHKGITDRHKKGRFAEQWYVFLLFHAELIKQPDGDVKFGVSLPGKWASKVHVDGMSNNIYYTRLIEDDDEKLQFKLRVFPEVGSTARSPHTLYGEDLFIDNDYQFIIDKLDNY